MPNLVTTKTNWSTIFGTATAVFQDSFICLRSYFHCNYLHRKYIPNFALIAKPLNDLTKKNRRFEWSIKQTNAFESLKNHLLFPPILGHPNYSLPMEIHCDACGYGLGTVLAKQQGALERVISYANRLLSPAESNYSVSEKECLALVWAAQRFKIYIWGSRIKVVTDHHSLCWLLKKRDLAGRLARWSLALQDLDLEIVHRSGRLHSDAKALSRFPIDVLTEGNEIPFLLIPVSSLTDSSDLKSAQEQSKWWGPNIWAPEKFFSNRRAHKLTKLFELKDGILFKLTIKRGKVIGFAFPPILLNKYFFPVMKTKRLAI